MSDSKALMIVPRSLDEVTSLAEVLAKSSLLPDALKGKVPDVVVSILAGQELGLAPMAAIRGVHVVQGKPVLSADTMQALVLSSGACEYFSCIEDTDARVTYETKRRGAPLAQKGSWTAEDTKRAGLNTKDNWRFYPRAMMKARAKAALARDVYPDVLAGCYTDDEIDHGNEPRTEYVQRPAAQPEAEDAEIVNVDKETALEAIKNATSVDQCKGEVSTMITALKLTNGAKTEVNDAYKAKLKQLRESAVAADPVAISAEPAA